MIINNLRFGISNLYYSRDGRFILTDREFGDTYTTIIVCDRLEVLKVSTNIDTNASIITLGHTSNDGVKEFQTKLENINSKEIVSVLLRNSVIIDDTYAKDITTFLLEQVRCIHPTRIERYHSFLGFHHEEYGKRAFYAGRSYNSSIESTYYFDKNGEFSAMGNREVYLKMIEEEVLPYDNLKLALVLGFLPPLVPLLYFRTACPNILINISGFSSKGKSSTLSLIASLWGSGDTKNDGLVKTFFATLNGLTAALKGVRGFPVIIDDYETNEIDSRSFSNLMYQFCLGTSKTRLDGDSNAKEVHEHKTSIYLSGEESIFKRVKKKGGLEARIIEFNEFEWTVSQANAERIVTTSLTHHGFLGPEFVQYLNKYSNEALYKKYDYALSKVKEKLPIHGGKEARISSKIAYIYLTSLLVNEAFGFNIDSDLILDKLVKNEINVRKSNNITEQLLDDIRLFVLHNSANFVYENPTSNYVPSKAFGKIYAPKDGKKAIYIEKSLVDDLLESKGYRNRENLLRQLITTGFLDAEQDRLTRRISISGLRIPAYKFLFPGTENFSEEEDEEYSLVNPIINIETPVIDKNYSDDFYIEEIFKDDEN